MNQTLSNQHRLQQIDREFPKLQALVQAETAFRRVSPDSVPEHLKGATERFEALKAERA